MLLPKKLNYPGWNWRKYILKIDPLWTKLLKIMGRSSAQTGPECVLPSTNGKSSLVPCELNPRKGKAWLASFYLLVIKKASYSSFPRSISASVIKLKQDVLLMFEYQSYWSYARKSRCSVIKKHSYQTATFSSHKPEYGFLKPGILRKADLGITEV